MFKASVVKIGPLAQKLKGGDLTNIAKYANAPLIYHQKTPRLHDVKIDTESCYWLRASKSSQISN